MGSLHFGTSPGARTTFNAVLLWSEVTTNYAIYVFIYSEIFIIIIEKKKAKRLLQSEHKR